MNIYQPIDSSEKFFFTTTSRNVSVVRYRMSLVTILLLDLVMIHLGKTEITYINSYIL